MFRKRNKKEKETVKNDLQGTKNCPYLYVDVFGHPYCTAEPNIGLECKFCVPSEEYVDLRNQLKAQGMLDKKNSPWKAPSTYRCTVFDEYADREGHLPPKHRPKPQGGIDAVTGFFD